MTRQVRNRAYRRHKRAVKLARRYRILREAPIPTDEDQLRPQAMHWHINCKCWTCLEPPRQKVARRAAQREIVALSQRTQ